MRKQTLIGAVLTAFGILVLATFSKLVMAYLNRPNARGGLQFSFGFVSISYPSSVGGAILGLGMVGLGLWAARRRETRTVEVQPERQHERPRSDKPVIGN